MQRGLKRFLGGMEVTSPELPTEGMNPIPEAPQTGTTTVLHLINGLQAAGAEHQLQQLVLASDRHLFRHIVVSVVDGGPIGSELEAAGFELHSLAMERGRISLRGLVRLVRLLRRLKPDVLHCWMYHSCLMGAIAGRVAGIPQVLWGLRAAHATLTDYRLQTRMVVRLCARLSGMADMQIVNSETGRKVHQQLGFKTTRMMVISNGIDARRFSPDAKARAGVREELGVAADTPLVGMFCRYDPMKDHATFLRAAAVVRQHHPEARFVLAGVGITEENVALAQLLRENQLEDAVFLLGPRRDIARLNAALDVACLSSWTESFPNVVVEAMACGVPSVVTNAGDSASVVDDTGRVAPVRDAAALAEAMESLLSMPATERVALGQKARERALARFTVEQCARAYEALYEKHGASKTVATGRSGEV